MLGCLSYDQKVCMNMKKKVGILTHYYGSHNYGGLLQAYALCKVLDKAKYDAKQISFLIRQLDPKSRQNKENTVKRLASHALDIVLLPRRNIRKRYKCMEAFAELIPHTQKVYSSEDIGDVNNLFDQFVVGSDQVWNLEWFNPEFFLSFAKPGKRCIAYAASMGKLPTDPESIEFTRQAIERFDAVSVREGDLELFLETITKEKRCIRVLDPTLLLSAEDWDEMCAERVVRDPYVFCYFLGKNKYERIAAQQYAKRNRCKIVTIPYMSGKVEMSELCWGDIRLNVVSPTHFVSLIKYAHCIFTDSFHAVVFSNIYNKEFYVFNRDGTAMLDSRIDDVVRLFGTQERYLREKPGVGIILEKHLTYRQEEAQQLVEAKQESIRFLLDNLE